MKEEEFKMVEGEDDMVDLLNEKKLAKDEAEFYNEQEESLEDLK